MRLIPASRHLVWVTLLGSAAAAAAAVQDARGAAAFYPLVATPLRQEAAQPEGRDPAAPGDRRHTSAPPDPKPRTRAEEEIETWHRRLNDDPAFERALGRLEFYRPLVGAELRRRGVPEDFVYLPIIESDYLPAARSKAGAAGMWQLMPATARAYGLEVSTWVDERKDPIRSTSAAIRHLRELHEELGGWQLAAAAYNCGGPRLTRAIGHGGGDRAYWSNRQRLPSETRSYLPKLIAAIRLGRSAEAKRSSSAAGALRFREVTISGGVPLTSVARDYAVSDESVIELNPHLILRSTPPGRRWPVRIPVTTQ